MGPHVVLSFLTVFVHHIGSVNHALCLETTSITPKPQVGGIEWSHLSPYTSNCVNAYLSSSNSSRSSLWQNSQNKLLLQSHSNHTLAAQNDSMQTHFDFALHSHCATKKRIKYTNNNQEWSPANVELLQAVAKITILVLLKIIIKYYIRGYLKTHILNKALYELVELISKALTIAIAKCAIKWALYPALRTAAKTFLIASLKSMVKPFSGPLVKGVKGASVGLFGSFVKFLLTLTVKVVIKTIALEMLVFVFENEATQMPLHQLMFRVALILSVKMSAKRICKLGKTKSNQIKDNDDPSDSSAPVDKIMMFATQKLVTKLVKIPLIKMLL